MKISNDDLSELYLASHMIAYMASIIAEGAKTIEETPQTRGIIKAASYIIWASEKMTDEILPYIGCKRANKKLDLLLKAIEEAEE